MRKIFYAFICMLIINTAVFKNLRGQNPIPIYRGSNDFFKPNLHNTLFIDKEGKIVFQLYPSQELITRPSSDPFIDDLLNQSLDPYYSDICIVMSGGGRFRNYRWLDKEGKILIDFEYKYTDMGRFTNGYVLVSRKLKSSGYNLLYLNEKGVNAFGNKEFWEASPFSEGMAAVQITKGGDWGWIDETGEMVLKPKGIEQSQILTFYGFSDELAKVVLRNPEKEGFYHEYFFNKEGDIALSIDSVFSGRRHPNVGHFYGGLLKVTFRRPKERGVWDIYYVNKQGEIVHEFEGVADAGNVISNLFYVETHIPPSSHEYRSKIDFFDAEGDSVKLNIPDSLEITSVKNFGRNFIQLYLKGKKEGINAIYNREKGKIVATCDNWVLGFTNNRILSCSGREDYYQITDFEGKIIWESDISKRTFTDISEALRFKEIVKIFESENESDFQNGLLELKNLERLEISNMKIIPPEIAQLTNLKELKISFFKNLGALPNELTKLPKLEQLTIHYCANYTGGIEHIVRNSSRLERLNNQRDGFAERL